MARSLPELIFFISMVSSLSRRSRFSSFRSCRRRLPRPWHLLPQHALRADEIGRLMIFQLFQPRLHFAHQFGERGVDVLVAVGTKRGGEAVGEGAVGLRAVA